MSRLPRRSARAAVASTGDQRTQRRVFFLVVGALMAGLALAASAPRARSAPVVSAIEQEWTRVDAGLSLGRSEPATRGTISIPGRLEMSADDQLETTANRFVIAGLTALGLAGILALVLAAIDGSVRDLGFRSGRRRGV